MQRRQNLLFFAAFYWGIETALLERLRLMQSPATLESSDRDGVDGAMVRVPALIPIDIASGVDDACAIRRPIIVEAVEPLGKFGYLFVVSGNLDVGIALHRYSHEFVISVAVVLIIVGILGWVAPPDEENAFFYVFGGGDGANEKYRNGRISECSKFCHSFAPDWLVM
jgi:hypothetical protein